MRKGRDKYNLAVGLDYDANAQSAPIVNVKGEQACAEQVVKIAKRYGVPIIENSELAQTLNVLELDQEIPESLYETVAVILSQLESKANK